MYASRNLTLCTKDCLCLFVCPTGATDTETGQIDRDRCVEGCRACVDACPSHAIHLEMERYPEPAPKDAAIAEGMMALCAKKTMQEAIAQAIVERDQDTSEFRLAKALKTSCRILAEDCAREAGYLTLQCRASRDLLEEIAQAADGETRSIVSQLMK